jgi:hypothetical protein
MLNFVPPAGIEPARMAPEAIALSTELRGHFDDANLGRNDKENKWKSLIMETLYRVEEIGQSDYLGCGQKSS